VIWPASILLARWVTQLRDKFAGKVVAEVGAGCGLPSLAAAVYCKPASVYITDIHQPALENTVHNVTLNTPASTSESETGIKNVNGNDYQTTYNFSSGSTNDSPPVYIAVRNVNWVNQETFPPEPVDVLIGSDLVYHEDILSVLIPAVDSMLVKGGSFYYVAPNTGRAGMESLVDALQGCGYIVAERFACPDSMYESPLENIDLCVLHFYDLTIKAPHTCYHFVKPT
jgi:predicted nicotinamide N-methyase